MKTSPNKPPNYDSIKAVLPVEDNAVFCYGDTVYNVKGELRKDLEIHELVHSQRQGDNPLLWWNRYLIDPTFRLEEELIAYAHQYLLVKKILPSKYHKEGLYEMARSLSSQNYGNIIGHSEAESKIRNYAKNLNGKENR